MDWQPIETAPKDGTLILVAFRGETIPLWWQMTTFWNINQEWDGVPEGIAFSHWQALPPPPTDEAE